MKSEKGIVFDSDVLIHFYKGGQLLILKTIFKAKILIPEFVSKEISLIKSIKEISENIIQFKIGT